MYCNTYHLESIYIKIIPTLLETLFCKIVPKIMSSIRGPLVLQEIFEFPHSVSNSIIFSGVDTKNFISMLSYVHTYIVFVSIAGEKPLDTYLSEKYPGVTLSEDAMDKIKKTKASDTYFCFTQKQMDS